MSNVLSHLPDYPRIALVLQGGGALGSYQAGVYEGLAKQGIHPNWVAGISIGALNCAIIAGNAPQDRVQRLHEFWETICSPAVFSHSMMQGHKEAFGGYGSAGQGSAFGPTLGAAAQQSVENMGHTLFRSMAAMSALMNGQEGFFKPRLLGPGSGSPDSTSFYDTTPLIATLEKFADFDRINSGETRVSLGATNVASGNFVYFDSKKTKLTPKHFIASGSLPPGFPATEIDGEFYWDGGCVSNTPLEYVLGDSPRLDTLVFQVDLWRSAGPLPSNILQVNERLKDIQFSSRTRTVTNAVHMMQRMRKVFFEAMDRIPESVRKNDPWFEQMAHHMMGARYNVIHLIYENKQSEGHYKDFQFSAETMQMHWQTGLHDMDETLAHPACLEMPAEGENFVTFDVHTHKRDSSERQFSARAEKQAPAVAAKRAAPAKKVTAKRGPAKKRVATKVANASASTKPSGSQKRPRRAPK